MKSIYILCTAVILVTGISSCDKVIEDKTVLCNNGLMDGGETEIDCGAACQPCPGVSTMSCKVGNTTFFASGAEKVYGMQMNPSIRIYGNDSRPLHFMFIPAAVNQPVPVLNVNFAYNGEAYTMEPGDSGYVTLTAIDTLRRIASGTFWFTAGRVTGPNKTTVTDGVFQNVRYNH